jgi:prefoldin subunit 5
MPQNLEVKGIFKDPIIQQNVAMLTLAIKNLALAGIKVEGTADDGWHKFELMHIGEQLINGKCNSFVDGTVNDEDAAADLELEIYASERIEVAPPDYITEEVDPNFNKLRPTVAELEQRGVLVNVAGFGQI